MNYQEIRDHQGHTFQLREYPRPDQLDSAIRQELLDLCVPLTAAGFLYHSVTPELHQDVAQHLFQSGRLVVTRTNGRVDAFAASTLKTVASGRLYHLEGIIVRPDLHGTGLACELLRYDLRQTQADLLGFHTQSARMRDLGLKLANLGSTHALTYGQTIGSRHQQGEIDLGRYGGQSLYQDEEQFSPIAIPGLNWQQGDAQILIGRVRQP